MTLFQKNPSIDSLLELALVLATRLLKDYCWEICNMFFSPCYLILLNFTMFLKVTASF